MGYTSLSRLDCGFVGQYVYTYLGLLCEIAYTLTYDVRSRQALEEELLHYMGKQNKENNNNYINVYYVLDIWVVFKLIFVFNSVSMIPSLKLMKYLKFHIFYMS